MVAKFAQAHTAMGAGYRKGFEDFKAAAFDPTVGDAAVAGIDRDPTKLLGQAGDRIAADSAPVAAAAATGARRSRARS